MVAQAQGIRPIESQVAIEPRTAGLGDMFKMEALKMRKRPMTWVIVALMLLGVVALPLVAYAGISATEFASEAEKNEQLSAFILPDGVETAMGFAMGMGQILLVVIAAGIIGSEYSWGTTRVLVGSGADRTKLMTAKMLYLALFSLLFLILGTLAGSVASLGVTAIGGHEISMGTMNGAWFGDVALAFLRNYFVLLVPVAIGFGMAAIFRSLAVGLAFGIGFLTLEGIVWALLGFAGSIGDFLNQLLITANMNSILALNGGSSGFGMPTEGISPWQATAVLSAYVVILVAASIITFRRRDVPSGG